MTRSTLSENELKLFEAVKQEEIFDIINLINDGVDPNCRDEWQLTPLMHATIDANVMSICALKEAGANFSETNISGETALMMATKLGATPDTINALIDGSGEDFLSADAPYVLELAVMTENLSNIETILNRGADVNAKGKDGIAPIFHALRCRNVLVLKTLLDRNADINVRDKEGLSPILYAIKYNDAQGSKDFLDLHNTKIENSEFNFGEIKNDRDYELLHFALHHNPKAIERLLMHGVSVFATQRNTSTRESDMLGSDKKVAFIDLCIQDTLTNAQNNKEDASAFMSMIIQKSLMQVSQQGRIQLDKWHNHLLPHLRDNHVHDLLNSDAIQSLKNSHIPRSLLKDITDNFNDRNDTQLASQSSSTDIDTQESSSLNTATSEEEEESLNQEPRGRKRSGTIDKTPATSPSFGENRKTTSKSTLQRTTTIGKHY